VVKFRVRGYFVGDWFCGMCLCWNWKRLERCRACKKMAQDVKENEMVDAGNRIVAQTDV
jgi:hypothetical protein